ncbi:hypothetical protein LCGC14_0526800 [marine sediment metagenome]|uniref:PDGLE domain-containing protein n=1 Tax=marine sediment metagenome TaxID=412755 RepID=A0A0F9V4Y6_9ZZZZ
MSHIEIPDGVLPVSWWLAGYIITILALIFVQLRHKQAEVRFKIPLLGVVAALMLIGMSLPLGFIPFHVNLAVFAGILLGPGLGFAASFAAVFFLSLIGHGGLTVVGLNTLTVGIEAVLAGYLYVLFVKVLRMPFTFSIVITTLISLIVSIIFVVAVVALSTNYGFTDVLQLQVELKLTSVALARFIAIMLIIAIIGITVETIVTTWIIGFIKSVRPDILER